MNYEADEAARDHLELDYGRRWIGGVCAGCANYFGFDPALVRVGTVVTGLFFPKIVIAAYRWGRATGGAEGTARGGCAVLLPPPKPDCFIPPARPVILSILPLARQVRHPDSPNPMPSGSPCKGRLAGAHNRGTL